MQEERNKSIQIWCKSMFFCMVQNLLQTDKSYGWSSFLALGWYELPYLKSRKRFWFIKSSVWFCYSLEGSNKIQYPGSNSSTVQNTLQSTESIQGIQDALPFILFIVSTAQPKNRHKHNRVSMNLLFKESETVTKVVSSCNHLISVAKALCLTNTCSFFSSSRSQSQSLM